MSSFMPRDEHKANLLNEKLAKTMFKSPAEFITFYNSGIINKKHKDVQNFAKAITKVFKNVREMSNKLIFITEQEVYLEEITKELSDWECVVKIKRELNPLVQNQTITEDETIYFNPSISGIFKNDENGEPVKLSTERILTKSHDVDGMYNKWSNSKNEQELEKGNYTFLVKDWLQLDDTFISRIKEITPQN